MESAECPPECPTRQDLYALAQGNLTDAEADRIVDHLDHCRVCDQVFVEIEKQSSLGTVVSGAGGQFAQEDECHAFVGSLQYRPEEFARYAGSRIREYQLLDRLGGGAMGTVYRAWHRRLNKYVAIKLLSDRLGQDLAAKARFQREMLAVGQLEHTHIVRALDAGESDGIAFLVMEFVDGVDLARLTSGQRQMNVADACEAVRQVAAALQYVHARGLIHRDIKPSNLMLGLDANGLPQVKILDLGLAIVEGLESHQHLTDDGQLMGTLEFMAPEQAENTHSVDYRADIYALGATLYRLLTASVPFSGPEWNSPPKRLQALIQSTAPSIAERRDDLAPELVQLVDRMLAREPQGRPADMAEVAALLEPWAAEHRLDQLLQDWQSEQQRESPAVHFPLVDTTPSLSATVIEPRGSPAALEQPATQPAAQPLNQPGHRGARWGIALATVVAMILVFVAIAAIPKRSQLTDNHRPEPEPSIPRSPTEPEPAVMSTSTEPPVELWRLVVPETDRLHGEACLLEGDTLRFPHTGDARDLTWLPVHPTGAYRFQVAFGAQDRGTAWLVIPVDRRLATFQFYNTGQVSLEKGLPLSDNGLPLARAMINDWRQRTASQRPPWDVEVEFTAAAESVRIALRSEDNRILEWQGTKSDLGESPLEYPGIALGHHSGETTFVAPTLLPLNNPPRFFRPEEAVPRSNSDVQRAARIDAIRRLVTAGATVEAIIEDGSTRTFLNPDEVPSTDFRVLKILLWKYPELAPDRLEWIMTIAETETLWFGGNLGQSGLARLGTLKNLKLLYLHQVDLTSSDLPSVQGFEKLETLRFDKCQNITALDLPEMATLEWITVLEMRLNDIRGIAKLPNLKRIHFTHSKLEGDATHFQVNPPNLEEIILFGGNYRPETLTCLASISSLKRFTLGSINSELLDSTGIRYTKKAGVRGKWTGFNLAVPLEPERQAIGGSTNTISRPPPNSR